uniref:Uncharacterized protein n=1 Tax=Plectus sambesii TaxID=2011161 RepID=A0A914WYN5_9BILA
MLAAGKTEGLIRARRAPAACSSPISAVAAGVSATPQKTPLQCARFNPPCLSGVFFPPLSFLFVNLSLNRRRLHTAATWHLVPPFPSFSPPIAPPRGHPPFLTLITFIV